MEIGHIRSFQELAVALGVAVAGIVSRSFAGSNDNGNPFVGDSRFAVAGRRGRLGRQWVLFCAMAGAMVVTRRVARADQTPATAPAQYVSREEYDRAVGQMLREQEAMRKELAELKRQRTALPENAATPPAAEPTTLPTSRSVDSSTATNKAIADLQRDVRDLHEEVGRLPLYRSGFDQFVLAGDAAFGFSAVRHSSSSFDAGIAPLILWRPADRVLIEAAADIGVSTDPESGSSTSFDLTIANVQYELTDNLVVGAGLFVVPFGVYHNHFDPSWINKFADDPLPFSDGGIAPSSEVGVFIRGAVPAGRTRITYDAYVTNGPQLITTDPAAAGSLNFDDFTDLNGNKAFGGRISWIPLPNMEMGYSLQVSEPNADGFSRAHATLQAVDFNYRPKIDAIGGMLDFRTEWVWSNVSEKTYDPDGSLSFGPTRFSNYRQGGYVQLCYRPTKSENSFLRDLEFVGRFDWLTTPLNAPGGEHERRVTLGVDYWIAPNVVLKAAYEFDHKKVGENTNGFFVQLGLGL